MFGQITEWLLLSIRIWDLAKHNKIALQRRHNKRVCVWNHQPHDCLINRLFKAQMKENIKALRHWPLCGEFTGDRWIPCTKGPVTRKIFPFDDVIVEKKHTSNHSLYSCIRKINANVTHLVTEDMYTMYHALIEFKHHGAWCHWMCWRVLWKHVTNCDF